MKKDNCWSGQSPENRLFRFFGPPGIAQKTSNSIFICSMHYYPSVAPMQPFSAKSIEGINSCLVPIYNTWIERDNNCRQNTLSMGHTHRVEFEPTTLWLRVESMNWYTTVLAHSLPEICVTFPVMDIIPTEKEFKWGGGAASQALWCETFINMKLNTPTTNRPNQFP